MSKIIGSLSVRKNILRLFKFLLPTFTLLMLIALCLPSELFAVTQVWVARYNGPVNGMDHATDIVVDKSGNVYVTGYSRGSGTDYDYCTIKYDSAGNQKWAKRYSGPDKKVDHATAIAVDNSGNVYVTGCSKGSDTNYDYCTIKYDSTGNQKWAKRYNYPVNGEDHATAIAVDNSGNVYVTGYSKGSGNNYDYCTIKYDSAGIKKWAKRYNGPGNGEDYASAIALDSGQNIIVTGYVWDSSTNRYDFGTIKYNPAGTKLWYRKHNHTSGSNDKAYALAVDNGDNVYITGGTTLYSDDFCTVKYDSAGIKKWAKKYNRVTASGNWADCARDIAVDKDGNVYIVGTSIPPSSFYSDYCTIKYDTNGQQKWVRIYDSASGYANDFPRAIALDSSSNVYVTGASNNTTNYYNHDYCTIKYNKDGVRQWIKRYNGPAGGDDLAYDIAVYGDGNVYVTGESEGSGSSKDYCTIKYK